MEVATGTKVEQEGTCNESMLYPGCGGHVNLHEIKMQKDGLYQYQFPDCDIRYNR